MPLSITGVNIGSFAKFAEILDKTGYRPGNYWAIPVFITEFVAGPLMAVGLFTCAVRLIARRPAVSEQPEQAVTV